MRLFSILLVAAFLSASMATVACAENYAFLVAVQDYDVKSLRPLKFSRKDIEDFATVLKQSGFKSENIVVMTDNTAELRYAAESAKIRKQLDILLAGIGDKDTLIVALAGHGVQFAGDEKSYFCPADADLNDPSHSRLLAISEIYGKLKNCGAQRKLLIVDACRNDPVSKLSRSREVLKLESITRPQTEAVPKGVVALFSCAAGQEAFEFPALKHGIFFHHFMEGWRGAADNGDKIVTLDEVISYAREKTQSFARTKLDVVQTPQLKSDFDGTWILRDLKGRNQSELNKQSPRAIASRTPVSTLKSGNVNAPDSSTTDLKEQQITPEQMEHLRDLANQARGGKTEEDKKAAVQELAALGNGAEEALRILATGLVDRNERTRQLASEAIEGINPAFHKIVISIATDNDYYERKQSLQRLRGLGQIGRAASPVLWWRLDQLSKTDSIEYISVLETLCTLTKDDKKLSKLLVSLTKSADRNRAISAVELLPDMELNNKAEVVGALTSFLQQPVTASKSRRTTSRSIGETEIRVAIVSLGKVGAAAKTARELLKKYKGHSSKEIREAADTALNLIGDAGSK